MQFKVAESLKSIGTVSERSHFPLAKIKHFTRSCQILIRRKLEEEYHFPKTNRSSVSPPWVVSPSYSLSPTLISPSVISFRLNANSEEAGAAFHSNRSFVIKNPCGQALCAGRSRLLFEKEKMRSPVRLSSREQPQSLPAPARTHWRKSVLNLQARSHQNNICVFGLLSVILAEKRGEKKNERKYRTEHKEMCRKQQPTQDSIVEREEGSSASTATPVLQSSLSR